MTSKLGPYWSVMHRRPQDYDFFKRLNPAVIKCMDGGPPDYLWIKENLSDALVVARIHALSEQHGDVLKDPIGTGIRHAQEWDEHAITLGLDRSRTLVLGLNEPRVWDTGMAEALRRYTISFCDAATDRNLRVGAMQLSVGWPNNKGPDTLPDWSLWPDVELAIQRNDGMLVCHEYWADNGPQENWGWWAGRSLKCPWQVPIVIGECGIDMYVKTTSVDHAQRGWIGRKTPDQYAQDLAQYVGLMSKDIRFVGSAVFAADYASGEWYSFDIEPAYNSILMTPIPTVIHIPVVIAPTKPTYAPSSAEKLPLALSGIVSATILNVRTGPSTDYEIVAKRVQEDQVNVTAISGEGQNAWYQIGIGQWVYSRFVTLADSAPPIEKWNRSIAFVARWEGGYQNVENDAGNWTSGQVGVGENKGTNWGISAASYPHLDIKNLTQIEAHEIFERDYWQASGANQLDWPACLLVFDTAILHGIGTAISWLEKVGPNPYVFAANRLRVYTKMKNWDFWGKAWVNRMADLLDEMAK